VQIDHYTASTSYVGFQNGLSKAIGSIRKPIRKFSTGGQLVGRRCLYSNEVNNVKDLFLPCEASALFEQVAQSGSCEASGHGIQSRLPLDSIMSVQA
jgi:hypothetical protein